MRTSALASLSSGRRAAADDACRLRSYCSLTAMVSTGCNTALRVKSAMRLAMKMLLKDVPPAASSTMAGDWRSAV